MLTKTKSRAAILRSAAKMGCVNVVVLTTLISAINLISACLLFLSDDSNDPVARSHTALRLVFAPTSRLVERLGRDEGARGQVQILERSASERRGTAAQLCQASERPGSLPPVVPDDRNSVGYATAFNSLPLDYQLRIVEPHQPANILSIYTEELQLPRDYAPFRTWKRSAYVGRTHSYDKHGSRIHKPLTPKQSMPRTVGFFGGSTVEGFGVDDQGTIPALFDRLTSDCVARNHGVYSYNSRQSLETFIDLLNSGIRPDIAVFYDGINDVTESCKGAFSPNTHSQESVIRERLGMNPLPGNLTCDIDTERARLAAQVLVENWRHARAIAEQNNIEFLAILQPVVFVGHARTDHVAFRELGVVDSPLKSQYMAVYPIVKQKMKILNLPWMLDLTDALDGDAMYYTDFAHLSADGNQVIAERILATMAGRR
jgi:lysophospholipase L1-like esterase